MNLQQILLLFIQMILQHSQNVYLIKKQINMSVKIEIIDVIQNQE